MGRRHHSIIAKLNRNTKQRKSLFKIQLNQLIERGTLTTTVTKAKIIKRLFDRLAHKAQDGSLAARRRVIAELSNTQNAHKLVDLILPAMGSRQSGFTTIQKVGLRLGDSTSIATLKLVIPMPAAPEKPAKAEKAPAKKAIKKSIKK